MNNTNSNLNETQTNDVSTNVPTIQVKKEGTRIRGSLLSTEILRVMENSNYTTSEKREALRLVSASFNGEFVTKVEGQLQVLRNSSMAISQLPKSRKKKETQQVNQPAEWKKDPEIQNLLAKRATEAAKLKNTLPKPPSGWKSSERHTYEDGSDCSKHTLLYDKAAVELRKVEDDIRKRRAQLKKKTTN